MMKDISTVVPMRDMLANGRRIEANGKLWYEGF